MHVYVTTAALHQLVKRDEPDAWQSTFSEQPESNLAAGHIVESILAQSLSSSKFVTVLILCCFVSPNAELDSIHVALAAPFSLSFRTQHCRRQQELRAQDSSGAASRA